MVPVVCIVGRSDTGKTTLMEKLVSELKGRGYRVASIKHTGENIDFDKPNKDSWRLAMAGSDLVLLSTPERVITNRLIGKEASLDEVMYFVGGDFDVVLVEGFHKNEAPKIEVHRKENGKELLSSRKGLMAVVTDEELETNVPQFSSDDAMGVADLIVRKLLASRDGHDMGLFVDGLLVRTGSFVSDIFSKTLAGMVSSLKGAGKAVNIDIWIREKRE
ncbi:molybdopterin-guanine dinucleotide biosynthesis protein B [Chloroflexota bacterium]